MNASTRRRTLGCLLLAIAAMGLYGLGQFGLSLSRLPASFQLMLLPTLLAPLLGGVGLLFEAPPRASRLACAVFLGTMGLMTAWPLVQLPMLFSGGGWAAGVNALTSIVASLFWLSQLTRIVFEPEPELNFVFLRLSLGLAIACSMLVSLWQAWDVQGAWAFQLQATGSAFYGFSGWKVWNGVMALLSLGFGVLGASTARRCLQLWCLGWLVGGLLLINSPFQMGLSSVGMMVVALFPVALGGWLLVEQE